MSTIGDLLQRSRDAHIHYREHLARRVPSGNGRTVAVDGNLDAARGYLVEACRLRADAHVLDPEKHDPAWADEPATYPHEALLTFYAEQLSR